MLAFRRCCCCCGCEMLLWFVVEIIKEGGGVWELDKYRIVRRRTTQATRTQRRPPTAPSTQHKKRNRATILQRNELHPRSYSFSSPPPPLTHHCLKRTPRDKYAERKTTTTASKLRARRVLSTCENVYGRGAGSLADESRRNCALDEKNRCVQLASNTITIGFLFVLDHSLELSCGVSGRSSTFCTRSIHSSRSASLLDDRLYVRSGVHSVKLQP